MNQSMSYTPAGWMRQRADAADALNSRYYGYDALGRMICEVRGNGTSADCNSTSSLLASLLTYGDGQGAAMPADARMSAYIHAAGSEDALYTSTSLESYVYLSGSSQVQGINRTGGNLGLQHDGLGRRRSDSQGADPASRREYTYLPNGQLGSVHGVSSSGSPYEVNVQYDAEGRPLTIAYGSVRFYELFWDDSDRLLAVSVTGDRMIRWHYHYLDAKLIAATRESIGEVTDVKRFWTVSDERGLISRLVDENGATYWQARWDATAWRSLVGAPQPDMWVPFGLPGQIILDGTEAGAVGSVRPAIALNQLRAYDPFVGGFLQPDPADQQIRLLAEGYLYGRGDYIGSIDPTGAKSEDAAAKAAKRLKRIEKEVRAGWKLRIDDSCNYTELGGGLTLRKLFEDQSRVANIIRQIEDCKNGMCGTRLGPNLKRKWKSALLVGKYLCSNDEPIDFAGQRFAVDKEKGTLLFQIGSRLVPYASAVTFIGQTYPERVVIFGKRPSECWSRDIAHEALHAVLGDHSHREMTGEAGLENCISCNKWMD